MKIIQSTLVSVSIFLIFYLLGSFYSADFDIKLWTSFTRYTISFLGGLFSLLAGGIYLFKDKI